MEQYIEWFRKILDVAIRLYFCQECDVSSIYEVRSPNGNKLEKILGIDGKPLSFDEQVVILLALMPHLCPQILDILFVNNKNFDRPYTEFGGWKGLSHGGFLPTGETAAFILSGDNFEKRREVYRLFLPEHRLRTNNILLLDGQGKGEPFLSGKLEISEEILSRILQDKEFNPDYNIGFPAKRIVTQLDWKDVVLDYNVTAEIEEINNWIKWESLIMDDWGLGRFLKPGYRTLFYGPPGTGKTLTATLIGKRNQMDVYRIDLSMIVSKYIGETEKNLAHVFDLAENKNWILFFDEADALFGKRTSTNTSNDRHANQEVAYLLQRIEDFPGIVILATNLRSNIDAAFSRRFQSVIYFPMPDEELRIRLWENMLWKGYLKKEADELKDKANKLRKEEAISGKEADSLEKEALDMEESIFTLINQCAHYELSGGSISNVIRRCALRRLAEGNNRITKQMLIESIQKEIYKEGRTP